MPTPPTSTPAAPPLRPEDVTVLIPAAGRVPEGLLALSNIACTAQIPVAGRPVIYWTLRYLTSLGLRRFTIAVPERGLFVEDFVECTAGAACAVDFVVPPGGSDGGPGQTLAALLETVETRAALVVLGDTYFQFADPGVLWAGDPAVLVGPVEESYRWCVAERDGAGRLTRLRDKEPGLPGPLDALIGVYVFPDAAAARTAARAAVADPAGGGDGGGPAGPPAAPPRRVELKAILERLHAAAPIRVHRAGEWLDCGNPDRQAASHVTLLQKREFNELAIDRVRSTITKRSRMKRKFIDEINYVRLLPPDLAVLFPRVVDFSVDWADPWVTMEFYGYATLADVWVYENVDPGVWGRVFEHLYAIVTGAFMRYRQPLDPAVVADMYLTKTRRRVDELAAGGSAELDLLVRSAGPVRVNGRACPSLAMVWDRVVADVAALGADATGSVIHGDLCLSNILYDLRSQLCKLVDPRGSFGSAGVMGDPRYDVAKLYHSVRGLYDFITNDLFHVSVAKGTDGVPEVALDVRARPQHRQVLRRFEQVFFGTFDRREVTLITALIFVSIPALHYDKPPRQLAMVATAAELFAELYPV